METLHLVKTKGLSIFSQLELEEALLRSDERNWCIFNEGSLPMIVMGISGKPSLLINASAHKKNPIPIIRRFSGGGTVVVDENTLFVSFIFGKNTFSFPPFPEAIYRWSEEIYKEVFPKNLFQRTESDYCIGEKKCGGNAQYIQKNRWLHHTTFLWDYEKEKMDLLHFPQKVPLYRKNRSHEEFLTKLKDHFSSEKIFFEKLQAKLSSLFSIQEMSFEQVLPLTSLPHRKSLEKVLF